MERTYIKESKDKIIQKLYDRAEKGQEIFAKLKTSSNALVLEQIEHELEQWDNLNFQLLKKYFSNDDVANKYMIHLLVSPPRKSVDKQKEISQKFGDSSRELQKIIDELKADIYELEQTENASNSVVETLEVISRNFTNYYHHMLHGKMDDRAKIG